MASNPESGPEMEHITLNNPKVLVVDDSKITRLSISRILADDFNVVEAEDGARGWNVVNEDEDIQVVFVDLMMPTKNGFELLRDIRNSSNSRVSQIPVIIITSHEDDEKMKRHAMMLGASDFISKPFDSIQIKARANSYAWYHHANRKLENARMMLEEKSTIDTLTGMANPRYLKEHGPELLAFAARQGTDIAVLRLDIDKFDLVVQKVGRQVTDKILLNVSKIIRASVRKEDGVARIGSAKFAIIMPGADSELARSMAERIHALIRKSVYKLGQGRFRITASAGLVTNNGDEGKAFEEVITQAEEMLNQAIRGGGNTLIVDEINDDNEKAVFQQEQKVEPLTLEEALVLLKAGQSEKVRVQITPLMIKLYPLLFYGNTYLNLGLDESLGKMKQELKKQM